MTGGSRPGFASPLGAAAEDVRNHSVPELIASLRSDFGHVTFEEVQKALEAMQRRSSREAERLRSENESFKNERERLISEKTRLEHELLKCRAIRDECAVAERPGIAEDVYDVGVERVGRGVGGGGTSLKEMFDELTRKNEELEGEKRELESELRIWEKRYKELDERVLQLKRGISMPKNEEQCLLGSRERESAVLGETGGLISAGACGDRGSTRHRNDSEDGGTVSFACNAGKKLDFGTGASLSPLAGSSRKSPVKEDGVLQGNGSFPFVEVSDNDDDCGGPLGDVHCGRRNDEEGHKELKRKRGPPSSVLGETFTQTLWAMAAALKQCEQKRMKDNNSDYSLSKSTGVNPIKHENGAGSTSAKSDYESFEQKLMKEKDSDNSLSKTTGVNPIEHENRACATSAKSDCGSSEQKRIKEKDSDNSSSKSTGVNPIKHENRAGSASAKLDYGSSLHKERWKSEADMLLDFTQDDELCMKAVCALYRRQSSKSMQRSACGSFDGLLSPRENSLAQFLTGGDPEGKLKKSVMNLCDHCPEGPSVCRSIATIHFQQLFTIYWKKEDPFFPSL